MSTISKNFQISQAGLEKMLPRRLGQGDFPSLQVPFHLHLPTGQGIELIIHQLNH